MNDLDKRIQAALQGTDGGDALVREPNLAEELIDTFRGRHRWLLAVAGGFSFVLFAIALWSGIKFYGAATAHDQILWGAVCLLAFLSSGLIKIYFWMEMHTNRILREVKRVELLVLQRTTPR